MKVIKKMIAAFSIYSRIPMPHLSADEDYEGAITFLPLVGVVIAAAMYGLSYLLHLLGCPTFAGSILILVVPLVITGGFHVDGFMDTTDALRSYGSREKKLEILKDAHVGAFAVTGLVTAMLFMIFATDQIMYVQSVKGVPVVLYMGSIFVISRALAGITSVSLTNARDDGMLASETKGAKYTDVIVLAIPVIVVLALISYYNIIYAGVLIAAFAFVIIVYNRMAMKNFGGVTGDTCGYFIVLSETVASVLLAMSMLVFPPAV
ncbi:MAG: adenosylcobinamide-GDP ribazoletransferase [Lachnospiraceae bacterium]|nr:adenosylcobinamide-GDP ribazoletransferase [Lachnospiraceae bacterium]